MDWFKTTRLTIILSKGLSHHTVYTVCCLVCLSVLPSVPLLCKERRNGAECIRIRISGLLYIVHLRVALTVFNPNIWMV